MTAGSREIRVILEQGKKRVFASALDWPGWVRSGKDAQTALAALSTYAHRYSAALQSAAVDCSLHEPLTFVVRERLTGNATTDFGAPDVAARAEREPVSPADLQRLLAILHAAWQTFAQAVASAQGKQLRKGPRGGGRTTEQIVEHVLSSHYSYLRQIYWRETPPVFSEIRTAVRQADAADAEALAFAVSPDMPATGPRGGNLWLPRYFVRRAAWHILDHAWEIEDRII